MEDNSNINQHHLLEEYLHLKSMQPRNGVTFADAKKAIEQTHLAILSVKKSGNNNDNKLKIMGLRNAVPFAKLQALQTMNVQELTDRSSVRNPNTHQPGRAHPYQQSAALLPSRHRPNANTQPKASTQDLVEAPSCLGLYPGTPPVTAGSQSLTLDPYCGAAGQPPSEAHSHVLDQDFGLNLSSMESQPSTLGSDPEGAPHPTEHPRLTPGPYCGLPTRSIEPQPGSDDNPYLVSAGHPSSVSHTPTIDTYPRSAGHPLRASLPPIINPYPRSAGHPLSASLPPIINPYPRSAGHPLRVSLPPIINPYPRSAGHPLSASLPPIIDTYPGPAGHPLSASRPPTIDTYPESAGHPSTASHPPIINRFPGSAGHLPSAPHPRSHGYDIRVSGQLLSSSYSPMRDHSYSGADVNSRFQPSYPYVPADRNSLLTSGPEHSRAADDAASMPTSRRRSADGGGGF